MQKIFRILRIMGNCRGEGMILLTKIIVLIWDNQNYILFNYIEKDIRENIFMYWRIKINGEYLWRNLGGLDFTAYILSFSEYLCHFKSSFNKILIVKIDIKMWLIVKKILIKILQKCFSKYIDSISQSLKHCNEVDYYIIFAIIDS